MISSQIISSELDTKQLKIFNKKLDKKIKILEKYLKKQIFDFRLTTQILKINNSQYKVKFKFTMPKNIISLNGIGNSPEKALEVGFNSLKNSILKKIEQLKQHSKSKIEIKNSKKRKRGVTKIETRKEYEKRLLKLIKPLKQYIQMRVNTAEKLDALIKGSIYIDEMVNEIISVSYDQLENKPSHQDTKTWLYLITDKVLQEKFDQEKYNQIFEISWQEYAKSEDKRRELANS